MVASSAANTPRSSTGSRTEPLGDRLKPSGASPNPPSCSSINLDKSPVVPSRHDPVHGTETPDSGIHQTRRTVAETVTGIPSIPTSDLELPRPGPTTQRSGSPSPTPDMPVLPHSPSVQRTHHRHHPHVAKPTPVLPTIPPPQGSGLQPIPPSSAVVPGLGNNPRHASSGDGNSSRPYPPCLPSSPLLAQAAPGFPSQDTPQEGASAPPRTPPATLPFLDCSTLAAAKHNLSLRLREFSDKASTRKPQVRFGNVVLPPPN